MSKSRRSTGKFHDLLNRSLSKAGYELQGSEKIRSNVHILRTNEGKMLVKGFSHKKLKAQQLLIKKLKKNGFKKTYSFLEEIPSFEYDGESYGFIEYLQGSNRKFAYDSSAERKEGLELLDKFHSTTRKFHKSIPVSVYHQSKKWEERLEEFEENTHAISKYVPSGYLNDWIRWGRSSLAGLKKYEKELYDEGHCIIHGDVAHHNFFRKKSGSLYLIDFDLISVATPSIDFLQYSNRIMPNIKDMAELFDYKQIARYRSNRGFLYALTYPTDIFREWNRVIRKRSYDQGNIHSVWKLSVEEAGRRMQLYEEIARLQ
ncbi:MAG: phosphotransferase [Bacillus sp. (in: firmicutes)]